MKRKYVIIISLLLTLTLTVVLFMWLPKKTKDEPQSKKKSTTPSAIEKEDEKKEEEKDTETPVEEENPIVEEVPVVEQPVSYAVYLDVPFVDQRTYAMSGCESASWAMVLQYLGKPNASGPEVLARIPNTGNGYTGYSGDVYVDAEVYPSGMDSMIRSYGVEPLDLSWNLQGIKDSLFLGKPVVVWGLFIPFTIGNEWAGMHVVTFTGYENGVFFYHDPMLGANRSITESRFLEIWIWPQGQFAQTYQ